MGLYLTISKINSDFSRKSQNFPTLCILRPTEGVPLGIGYRRWGGGTRVMELLGRTRSLTISSVIWIQCTNMTDRHWATAKTALTHSIAWSLLSPRMMGGDGDNWRYKTCKAPVKCHHQHTNIQFFLQARYPSCRPTNSIKAVKGSDSPKLSQK